MGRLGIIDRRGKENRYVASEVNVKVIGVLQPHSVVSISFPSLDPDGQSDLPVAGWLLFP